ncbi:hypothetical protein BH11GEM2_BH11GEM2_22290 [soil metagenome]
MIPTFRSLARLGSFALFITSVAACSGKAKDGSATAADSAAGVMTLARGAASADQPMAGVNVDASMKGMQDSAKMAGMAMTGDADHDFLRMMSDHHKGLTVMAHGAKEMKLPVAADATKLDIKQDGELDKMMTMLEKQYKDPYTPKSMPSNQAMIDALKGKTGKDYQKTFYANVVQHHQEAIKMIDDYLPTAKSPEVKAMAEKMKADQTKEIAEFQQKAAKL